MKYCTHCKIITDNDKQVCCYCNKKLISNPNFSSPAKIVTANGFEIERIRAALTDAEIAFSIQQTKNDTGLQILNSAPPENCNIFVPISDYDEAVSVLAGIGALKEEEIKELDEETKENIKKAKQTQDDDMSPRKRFWIKVLSGIGFLIILALVTYLADFLVALVKNLFNF